MTYMEVRKTIRDADGRHVMSFDDVVLATSTAWDRLQAATSWTTQAVGYAPGATVTFERAAVHGNGRVR